MTANSSVVVSPSSSPVVQQRQTGVIDDDNDAIDNNDAMDADTTTAAAAAAVEEGMQVEEGMRRGHPGTFSALNPIYFTVSRNSRWRGGPAQQRLQSCI